MHMEEKSVDARVTLNPYTKKVLAVLKAKYSLKDKSEAINKFTELYGDEIVEQEAKEEYIKKIIEITDKHLAEYKDRKMTLAQLDKLCEV